MNFRTPVPPLKGLRGIISHDAPVVLVGSCFSDNIGAELQADLFDAVVNPFGPLYNPASIREAVAIMTARREVTDEELFEHGGMWHSWQFHSRYSSPSREEALTAMNRSISDASDALGRASAVIITLGTTRVYEHDGRCVANCHKMPGRDFTSRLLDLGEVSETLRDIVGTLRSFNPALKIIFTVSPLRYLGNGARENTVIKSTLHLAVDSLGDDVIYFPAYEIVNDDLRDYRFYADDMIHPSASAVRYIYDIFGQTFFTAQTLALAADGRRLTRRLSHKSFSGTETQVPELEILEKHPALKAGFNRFTYRS